MKILFNKKFLEHNIESEAEGAYRINEFKNIADTEIDVHNDSSHSFAMAPVPAGT